MFTVFKGKKKTHVCIKQCTIFINILANEQFVFACWQAWLRTWLNWPAWTWLSWSAWTWLLTCLFMHAKTDCSWLDERTDLNNVFGTIMMNQWHAWYNSDEITRLNSDVTTTMNLVVTSSRILHGGLTYANNPCRLAKLYIQYVETWLNNTVILPILSCSFMSTVLLRGFEPTTL